MKKLTNLLITGLIGLFAMVLIKSCDFGYVTSQTFNQAYKELNTNIKTVDKKVDSANIKLDSLRKRVLELQAKLDYLSQNQDSLKAGQIVIYSAIKEIETQPNKAKQDFKRWLNGFLPRINNYLGLKQR